MRQWYNQQHNPRCEPTPSQPGTTGALRRADVEHQQQAQSAAAATATASEEDGEEQVEQKDGAAYALVVKKSKALAEGRRFDLACGSSVVVGRSQHMARIVIKDEMVRRVGDGGAAARQGRSCPKVPGWWVGVSRGGTAGGFYGSYLVLVVILRI